MPGGGLCAAGGGGTRGDGRTGGAPEADGGEHCAGRRERLGVRFWSSDVGRWPGVTGENRGGGPVGPGHAGSGGSRPLREPAPGEGRGAADE